MTEPASARPTLTQWISRQPPARQKLIMVGSVVLALLLVWLLIIPLMRESFRAGQRSIVTPAEAAR